MNECRKVMARDNGALCRNMSYQVRMDVIGNVIDVSTSFFQLPGIPSESNGLCCNAARNAANRKRRSRRRSGFDNLDLGIVPVKAIEDLIRILDNAR